MRQIALDTETTGIGHDTGHRLIEIGCIELQDRRLTGRTFHVYLNPQRAIDPGAFRVHGISEHFLQDKPIFQAVAADFLAFIGQAELIIHNAVFDLGFLNAELKKIKHKGRIEDTCPILDTLVLARKKHPGQRNSLDALCKRYDIDNSHRELHGALLDAQILAQLYLAMTGGQGDLFAEPEPSDGDHVSQHVTHQVLTSTSPVHYASEAEIQCHDKFIENILS